jgi:hypothetical protein
VLNLSVLKNPKISGFLEIHPVLLRLEDVKHVGISHVALFILTYLPAQLAALPQPSLASQPSSPSPVSR